MKNKIKKIEQIFSTFGLSPRKFITFVYRLPFYVKDYYKINKQLRFQNTFKITKLRPILNDRNSEGGVSSGHYFHQDLLIARKIFLNHPKRHIDIGSRIDGFVAHVASFREIEIFDIRPLDSKIKNIIYTQADLTSLNGNIFESCDSISSLHAIEHFGLGRYGDPIDINGHLKAIENISKILKIRGKFYFSVPIGKQRIEFNAHRIFGLDYLINLLTYYFHIDNFHFVDDDGILFEDVELSETFIYKSMNYKYSCGIFELTKK